MSEPRTDRVDVNAGAQKMDSSSVPDRVDLLAYEPMQVAAQ